VVSNVAEVAELKVPDPDRVAYLGPTTLSLAERATSSTLSSLVPNIVEPHSQDISTPPRTAR